MFLIIEIAVTIIASLRGWGIIPFLSLIGIFGGGFLLGLLGISPANMLVFDILFVICMIIMAVIGKKKPILENKKEEEIISMTRIKCPRCAELIMPDAKMCRFCGFNIDPQP